MKQVIIAAVLAFVAALAIGSGLAHAGWKTYSCTVASNGAKVCTKNGTTTSERRAPGSILPHGSRR